MTTHPRRHPLEKEGAIIVLLYISKKRKAKADHIIRDLPIAQTALYSTINRLKEAGLIAEEEKEQKFPFSKYLVPTEAGKQIAYRLLAINKIPEGMKNEGSENF